jgi:hypothetical protein
VLYQKKEKSMVNDEQKKEWNWQAIGELELNPERHKEAT